MSINIKYSFLEQAYPDMLESIGMLIQKVKLSARFHDIELSVENIQKLSIAKELCELRIIELWDQRVENNEFKALCATYFDISSQIPITSQKEYLIYEHFKIISFGYLGEQWHFVKQYLNKTISQFENIEEDTNWSLRILTLSFKALAHLVKKDSWHEIRQGISYINQLREEQSQFENSFLNEINEESRAYGAAELVSLYHFAKNIEILGRYLIEGRPLEPETEIQYHLNFAREFSQKSGNLSLTLLYQFFDAFTQKLIRNTIWYTTRGINNWVTRFNNYISQKEDKGLFELLYPQRESIIEGELLNPAHRAVVINLPTSSGKTLIAEYKILQALNQFKAQGGWIAYLAPTKALVNQVYIQLKKDLGSIGIKVEKASGAIDLDGFEQHLIEENGNNTDFDILVTTYEKMNLLVRQGLGTTAERPLVLTVVDEAHNIEESSRGLNLEFLLSTIKNDCEEANFLLMTPDIINSTEISSWLAGDRGHVINLELDWWQPNERIVGAVEVVGRGRNYSISLKPLHTDKGTYEIGESLPIVDYINAGLTKAELTASKSKIISFLAAVILDIETPIIILASSPNETYTIAEKLYNDSVEFEEQDEDVNLLIRLVKSELGENFPLAKYLTKRIAIHSSALPDDIRFLVEDLMTNEKLQAIIATTTIAQGINFPVSAVIVGSYNYPFAGPMPVRDFWNLAGRVGRAGQESMGWVGMAVRNDSDLVEVTNYVKKASDELHSQLVNAIDVALRHADSDFDRWLYFDERWSAILQFISHLRRQTAQQEAFLAQLELKLQGTFGYRQLSQEKKVFLREHLRRYASNLSFADAKMSDSTGFSSVSVRQMIGRLIGADINATDWNKNQLFSEQNQTMQKLVGIMLNTYEIRKSMDELNGGDQILDKASISRLVVDWVNGKELPIIAARLYPNESETVAIQKTTKALYKVVANSATWGLSALQKMPTSGIDWDSLSDIDKKKMANLPAYLHYGVNTDEGVLMRKNNVPRSIAKHMGALYQASIDGNIFNQTSDSVDLWLKNQSIDIWSRARPAGSSLSGEDYKKVWKKLNGI
ncbi:DEAD/DEAH box helicase [Chryseobacterium artocarpi]|uniref:DEAD/DEAH box helicase n=1 Tax=Chryseobacterium artocarpi TaxID=1414727 RepID=A0A1B8ZBY3_9FLAO|nr:DEAD/DEAH box helicase [Chryseobacterium artocarpi]OCA69074.1 DEAD/DEAH box helicase [Chryseobacterium artocarpi]